MLLSSIAEKKVYVGKSLRGYARGIGISLKTYAVKYLLCASNANAPNGYTDFSVSASSIQEISTSVYLKNARALQTKNCAKLFIGLPVFLVDGTYLGNVLDIEIQNLTVVKLLTNQGEHFPVTSVIACQDAVILRKELSFPIGQRIPAPSVFSFLDKSTTLVTKSVLKQAIQNGTLIQLTLSLPPFSFS